MLSAEPRAGTDGPDERMAGQPRTRSTQAYLTPWCQKPLEESATLGYEYTWSTNRRTVRYEDTRKPYTWTYP